MQQSTWDQHDCQDAGKYDSARVCALNQSQKTGNLITLPVEPDAVLTASAKLDGA